MSIEKLIQENILAIRELTSAIYDLTNRFEAQPQVAQNSGSGDDAPVEHGTIQRPDPAVAPEPVQPAQEDVTYDQVARALTEYANANGRDAALERLVMFGIKKLSEAKKSDYKAILESL
jgi:hypothetical protein